MTGRMGGRRADEVGRLSQGPLSPLRLVGGAIGSLLAATLLVLLSAGVADAKKRPEWVERGGMSPKYPNTVYLTGFGVGTGDDALSQARQMASADLASRISVRIESELSDVASEQDGEYSYKVAAVTRTTSDVRLSNLEYEIYQTRGQTYALAVIERGRAVRDRIRDRDIAMVELRACRAAADLERDADRKPAALATYETCRRPIAQAFAHQSVIDALKANARSDRALLKELTGASRALDREIESLLHRPARTLESAADALALQLTRQGVSKQSRITVSHFNFGTTNMSSSFGRQAGLELENALARSPAPKQVVTKARYRHADPAATTARDLAIRGVYLEWNDLLRLSATARVVSTGQLVASAESVLPLSAIPEHLELKPRNFEEALRDQKILSAGEFVSGDLRIEVWTNKGRGGVLYTAREELKLFMRVNRTAWVRLIYVLQNGARVPIDHAYYIDSAKVNFVVEYPETFEVIAPFGVEMIHATAFTEKPPDLQTASRVIEGEHYVVVADGLETVVRSRGIARKTKKVIAEDFVTVTTTPLF